MVSGRRGALLRPPPSEPDVHLSMHPAQAIPGGSGGLRDLTIGPLLCGWVVRGSTHHGHWPWRLVCPLVRGLVLIIFSGAHLATSARFRARAPGSVSGRLSTTISRRALISCSWFPAAFRPPALAFWSSCSRRGIGLSLRSAYRPARGRTQTGFPRFARSSCDRGGCSLYPGDDGAHPDWPRSPARICRFSTARPCTPPQPPSNARLRMTRHQRGFKQFTRPVFPSPVAPGWNASPWALPRASHPTLTGDARRSADRPSSTDPKQRSMSSTSLQTSVVYSKRATSCRTRAGGTLVHGRIDSRVPTTA